MPFDPVLVTLAEGLRETQHPFDFVARTGFKDLIESQDAYQKALNVLPKLIIPIKNALVRFTLCFVFLNIFVSCFAVVDANQFMFVYV